MPPNKHWLVRDQIHAMRRKDSDLGPKVVPGQFAGGSAAAVKISSSPPPGNQPLRR